MFNLFKGRWEREYERITENLDKKVKFKRELEDMVYNVLDNIEMSDGDLVYSDRYTLEYRDLVMGATSVSSPLVKFDVYDEDLNIVYRLQDRVFDIMSNQAPISRQMLLELEYWLSHDWKRD